MVNNLEFGAFWDGDNLDKESKMKNFENNKDGSNNKNSSGNKGIDDSNFSNYAYDDLNTNFQIEDSPDNKGINDPEFGAYGYDDSYTESKIEDNLEKKSNSGEFPGNRGINDPEFGAYGVAVKIQQQRRPFFFFQETLFPGTKVNLPRLLQKSPTATFLPQQIAESLAPMSNDNLPEILKNLSLKAESKGAVYVQVAVKNCARDEMEGEAKYCAASLESFVDSGVSVMGKNIRLLWHELAEGTKNPMFTIGPGAGEMGENNIVCHKMKYPYAVYLCHSIEKTEVYKVPLVSDDGTKANAMVACHKDTSAWSPNHVAFKILKVKPGSVPICHFLGRDTLVWIPHPN
ncbi:hypothetical protein V6N12_015933 [Hibiscus sabdariffa]|uniref:BURP domain-containing protein n=1 Tax=Hibiscus sabdariffa TaxID=183260 RepID=A0ABR2DPR8_9ROSI